MPADPKDLLIADLQHFGESMWRNEEMGERRLTFFIGLVTAVSTGLVALVAGGVAPGTVRMIAAIALMVLLALGLVTYLRMLKRDRITDQYKAKLESIRVAYIALCAGGDAAALAGHEEMPPERGLKLPGGGYAETVATIDGFLLAGTLLSLPARGNWLLALAIGAALTFGLWRLAAMNRPKG